MTRIILVRPGSTEFDEQGRIKGTLDIPLSENGERQVTRTVGDLSTVIFDSIYFAPGQASRETARRLATGRRVRLKELDDLTNLDHGLWHGKLIDEVRRQQPRVYRQFQDHPESICPPGGETLDHAEQRVRHALSKLLRRHRSRVIAIVVPEPLASVVRHVLTATELGDLWKAECDAGRWETLEIQDGRSAALA